MATARWATPSSIGSNIAGTALNSLANGGSSAFITHDNSSNLDLYAAVGVALGSFTSTTGASITLRVYAALSGYTPDDTGSVGGGDSYTIPLTVGASAKSVVFPMVRLPPFSCRLQITNNSGATFASSSNTLAVQPYNEAVA